MIYFIGKRNYNGIKKASLQDAIDYCTPMKVLPLDTEFNGFYPEVGHLHCIQIGDYNKQFVIDANDHHPHELKDLIESKTLIGQNIQADLRYLFHYGIVPPRAIDTLLTEVILTLGIDTTGRSYDKLVERYLGVNLSKAQQSLIARKGLLNESYVKYSALDVKYLKGIFKEQWELIKKFKLEQVWKDEHRYLMCLSYMAWSGVTVDEDKLDAKISKDKEDLIDAERELDALVAQMGQADSRIMKRFVNRQVDIFGGKKQSLIKWSSPKQVIQFFKFLGIDTTKYEKGEEKDSVEASVLEGQDHEIIPPYLHYKEVSKRVSSYGENIKAMIRPSGRIYTKWTQIKHTGRISSGSSKANDKTLNFQNIPGDETHRSLFIASEGCKLVQADYSQQENIIMADLSQDPSLLKLFREGQDLHSTVAKFTFEEELKDIPVEIVKELRPDLRKKAKSVTFAIAYGGTGRTIAINMGITVKEGDAIYDKYMAAFPSLAAYFTKQKMKALTSGYVVMNDVSNRRSYYPGFKSYQKLKAKVDDPRFWDRYRDYEFRNTHPEIWERDYQQVAEAYNGHRGNLERMSLNYPIQGTAADMMKEAGSRVYEEFKKEGLLFKIRMPIKVHDEMILDVPNEYVDWTMQRIKKHMEEASRKYLKSLTVKADPIASDHWVKD
jgi:DNA polymerase-1